MPSAPRLCTRTDKPHLCPSVVLSLDARVDIAVLICCKASVKSAVALLALAALLPITAGCTTLANRRDMYRYQTPDGHDRKKIAREAKERAANPAPVSTAAP